MESINELLVRLMARSGGKFIPDYKVGAVSPDIEWIKWLSYEPEFEKKRMEYLNSKRVSELSYEESEEASRYTRNKIFARLFKIYGTSECSEEDFIKVYNYMCTESIEELMLSKLTSEELQYAKQEITRLSQLTNEQLSNKVEDEQKTENYEQLSMIDSYILHFISNISYARSKSDSNKEFAAQIEANKLMMQRSQYNAANPYLKK